MNYSEEISESTKGANLILALIVSAGLALRLFFFSGAVFSDDSYYLRLSYIIYSGQDFSSFVGYPITLIRIGFTTLTSLAFILFGVNETAGTIFPLFFSLLQIILTYLIAVKVGGSKRIGLISAFLAAVFPADIIFSTMAFADVICIFFISMGIYLLFRFNDCGKKYYAAAAGFSFGISIFFKEYFYYALILLVILWLSGTIKKREYTGGILISLSVFLLAPLTEMAVYFFISGDPFYRFTITNANYKYCYYDFFPHSIGKNPAGFTEYFLAVSEQAALNLKFIFLRRYYLLLPLAALIESVISIKKKESPLLVYWFLGTVLLLVFFTTSFTEYKPIDLKNSWYVFPLFLSSWILAAKFIDRFNTKYKTALLMAVFAFSVLMCFTYRDFFDLKNLNAMKNHFMSESSGTVYTDHHTKYGIDNLRGYSGSPEIFLLPGKAEGLKSIIPGSGFLINKKGLEELRLQGHKYIEISEIEKYGFKPGIGFGNFIIYKNKN